MKTILPPDNECVMDFVLISQPKHILWVLKRTGSVRHVSTHYIMFKLMGKKIHVVAILCSKIVFN